MIVPNFHTDSFVLQFDVKAELFIYLMFLSNVDIDQFFYSDLAKRLLLKDTCDIKELAIRQLYSKREKELVAGCSVVEQCR